MTEPLQPALQRAKADPQPSVTGVEREHAQRLYRLAKELAPEGVLGNDYIALAIGETAWEVRFFTDRGRGVDVEFALFYPGTSYARAGFIVHADGRVEEDAGGHIPSHDVREGEPTPPSTFVLLGIVIEAIQRRIAG